MNEKAGWKASYESIQIITCTEAEYNTWKENTNDDFTPINGDLTYLHPDTYYYIYEDSIENKGIYYVSSEEFEKLQDQVNLKASNSGLEELAASFSKFKSDVTSTYVTTESAANIYATKEELSSNLTTSLENYYTKEIIDNDFVTKASLRGGIEGDSDDFVFVTQAKYSEDKDDIWEELNKTIKTDTEG
jgi:PHD/YefM family antitoxin component YafN of YafNO toxin-antitoxin module